MKFRFKHIALGLSLAAVLLQSGCGTLFNKGGAASGSDLAATPTAAIGGLEITAADFVIRSADGSLAFDMTSGSFGDLYSLTEGVRQTPAYDISDTREGFINAYVTDLAVFYGQADVSEDEAKSLPVWYIYADEDLGFFHTARGISPGAAVETVKAAYPAIAWSNYDCGYVEMWEGGWYYRIYFRFTDNVLTEIDLSKESQNGYGAGLTRPDGETAAPETPAASPGPEANRNYADNGDGTVTYKDFGLGVKLTYPDAMTVREDLLENAAVVDDGAGGFITVRNVTDDYWAFTGSNKKFVTNYITESVFPDFQILYGSVEDDFEMDVSNSDSDATLAVGEVTVFFGDDRYVLVRCVLQKTSFANGDSYIFARTQFAWTQEEMDALRDISLGGTRIG